MSDEAKAGWHVRTNRGKRGKHRFTIYDGSEIKAIAPINQAFASEEEADAAGNAVLAALSGAAELEQLRRSSGAKDREIDNLRADLQKAQEDNRTLGRATEAQNVQMENRDRRIQELESENERHTHHLGIANRDKEKLRDRAMKAEGRVVSWRWRCVAVIVLGALACWLVSIAVR